MGKKSDQFKAQHSFTFLVFTLVLLTASIGFSILHFYIFNYLLLAGIELIAAFVIALNYFLNRFNQKSNLGNYLFIATGVVLLLAIIIFSQPINEFIYVDGINTISAYLVYLFIVLLSIPLLLFQSKPVKLSDKNNSEVNKSHVEKVSLELTQKIKELETAQTTMSKLLRELNAERAKDGAILSSIGEGVIATDESAKVIFINPKAESMLGIRLIEIINKPFDYAFSEYNDKLIPLQSDERPIIQTLRSGKSVSDGTIIYETKDKRQFPVFTSVSPIILNGKTIGTINVFRDITHERDVDRMKTEFISLASHQLRTPLSAMKWFLQILENGDVGELTKEQKDIITNINQSNERMIDLVNSLLNVSRIESGRIIIDPTSTDIVKLVNSIITEIQPKLQNKKISLLFKPDNDLPLISVDQQLIREVYVNLLTNAIKYSPEGSSIEILITKNETDLLTTISDSGYGITEKDKTKVFSKFFRGENIIKFDTEGNGLGLYLIKQIIEVSNGKIWFTSNENKGTTFSFSIPLLGMQPKKGEVTLS